MGGFLGVWEQKRHLFGVPFCYQLGGDYWIVPMPR